MIESLMSDVETARIAGRFLLVHVQIAASLDACIQRQDLLLQFDP